MSAAPDPTDEGEVDHISQRLLRHLLWAGAPRVRWRHRLTDVARPCCAAAGAHRSRVGMASLRAAMTPTAFDLQPRRACTCSGRFRHMASVGVAAVFASAYRQCFSMSFHHFALGVFRWMFAQLACLTFEGQVRGESKHACRLVVALPAAPAKHVPGVSGISGGGARFFRAPASGLASARKSARVT